MPRPGNKGRSPSGSKSVKVVLGFSPQLLNRLLRSQRRCIPFRNTFPTVYNTSRCSRGILNKSNSEQKYDNFYYSSPKAATDMGVSSSESHDLTAFYEMLLASFGVLSQITGFYPSLDRIVETTLGPLNLGPGGRSYNKPISCLHRPIEVAAGGLIVSSLCGGSGPQCPAGVCGATNGWCQGGYWCRLHGSHTEGVP